MTCFRTYVVLEYYIYAFQNNAKTKCETLKGGTAILRRGTEATASFASLSIHPCSMLMTHDLVTEANFVGHGKSIR